MTVFPTPLHLLFLWAQTASTFTLVTTRIRDVTSITVHETGQCAFASESGLFPEQQGKERPFDFLKLKRENVFLS